MASFPTSVVVFPTRVDGTTIFAAHQNLAQDEIAAIEAALIKTAGQTNAEIRLRVNGNSLEWGHVNPAGYVNTLGAEAGTGVGFLAFNAEAGTNVDTYRTRGIAGAVVRAISGGVFTVSSVPVASADNQALSEYFRADSLGITLPGYTSRQGFWTQVAYNAGNFTASAGAWTVASGDQTTFAYTLVGKTMVVAFSINTSDVTAAPVSLQIAIPGGVSVARQTIVPIRYEDAGTAGIGYALVTSGNANILCRKANNAAWTTTAGNDTAVQGVITFEVV